MRLHLITICSIGQEFVFSLSIMAVYYVLPNAADMLCNITCSLYKLFLFSTLMYMLSHTFVYLVQLLQEKTGHAKSRSKKNCDFSRVRGRWPSSSILESGAVGFLGVCSLAGWISRSTRRSVGCNGFQIAVWESSGAETHFADGASSGCVGHNGNIAALVLCGECSTWSWRGQDDGVAFAVCCCGEWWNGGDDGSVGVYDDVGRGRWSCLRGLWSLSCLSRSWLGFRC